MQRVLRARSSLVRIYLVRETNPSKKLFTDKFSMTDFISRKVLEAAVVFCSIDLIDGGTDFSFECIGSVSLTRQAVECCHRGWGVSGNI